MLVTPQLDRRSRAVALAGAAIVGALCGMAGFYHPALFALALLAIPTYFLLRRHVSRRLAIMGRPFPQAHEAILQSHVAFYRALGDDERLRFRQMAAVFLDEIRITGVGAEVDDTVRLLVAASAIIPVFGFRDWDYHRLGEVLIYPSSFAEDYKTKAGPDANTLGMVGRGHLRGVMILSKPDLVADFDRPERGENVGVHEFTHEVEDQEADGGLPPEVPEDAARAWVRYVADELRHPTNRAGANTYAYKDDHEFLAVLSEYFFSDPARLKAKDPALYDLLRRLFHQDSAALLAHVAPPRHRSPKAT
jgi:Mlc titration factor MtfA (ptsG expression regulator)